MKEIKYVLGSQFGDEGKSKTVQYLCQKALNEGKKPLVIRYCSGPQASHTVIHDGITHVCSSFGSGVLLGVPTYIDVCQSHTLIDPIALKAEYEVLQQKGITPIYDFSDNCTFITPYDIIANRQNKESLANGTCGCGIWETINRRDKSERGDMSGIREFYGFKKQEELENQFFDAVLFLYSYRIKFNIDDYDILIMESSQGLLLDGWYGLKPYVTPCCIAPVRNINELTQFWWDKDDINYEIYLCTRTYTTRHGAGYTPTQSDYIKLPAFETNKDNQYQGQFKTGILDIDMINRAIDRHCLDNIENCKFNLVINHVDCVGPMFEYIKNGKICMTPGFNTVNTIQHNIRLKFNKVLWGDSPESYFHEVWIEST